MGKSLLNRLGKTVATCLASVVLATGIGIGNARASSTPWGSFTDIIPNAGNSISYTSTDSSSLPNNCSGIYYIIDGGNSVPVGGFDIKNGVVSQGYINRDTETQYGFKNGDTANTVANPNNTYSGYWQIFYDKNGDGIYGTQDGGVILNRNEQIDPIQYTISNFSSYGSANPGNFTFTTEVPESSTATLAIVGAGAIAYRRRKSIGEWVRSKFNRGGRDKLDKAA